MDLRAAVWILKDAQSPGSNVCHGHLDAPSGLAPNSFYIKLTGMHALLVATHLRCCFMPSLRAMSLLILIIILSFVSTATPGDHSLFHKTGEPNLSIFLPDEDIPATLMLDHVKGHQDDLVAFKDLPHLSQLKTHTFTEVLVPDQIAITRKSGLEPGFLLIHCLFYIAFSTKKTAKA